jgi:formamidopyrimidine-DNA glycosylase
MPELPEVQTTVNGLNSRISGLTIGDVWTDYGGSFHKGKDSIKDPTFFAKFKKEVIGAKIISVTRRAKNILIHVETESAGKNKSTTKHKSADNKKIILIHMKMTGHILYGRYILDAKKAAKKQKDPWTPAPDEAEAFSDPFNRFIHFVMTLSNGQNVALSDMRKFAKVTLIDELPTGDANEKEILESLHLANIGPEPLEKGFTYNIFKSRLQLRPNGRIKNVLMDQSIIAGVGNIYSDEALWRTGLHPEEPVKNIPDSLLKKLYLDTRQVLEKGIDFGGDSMSDYRNIDGERGKFQEQHNAYRKTGKKCTKPGCTGVILRKVVGGRSAHFCSVHQARLKK